MHRGFYFLKNLLREIGMQLKLYPLVIETLISITTWVECGTTTGTKKKNQILSISNLKNEDNNEVLKKKKTVPLMSTWGYMVPF